MRLLLSQLFYTSFPGIGFKTLASPQVPAEIQRAFDLQIVARYWNAYNPPPRGYQAAYLHQVTPEHTLFGWLYNDGSDELGRNHIPYFICYHLAQPLLDFELENLFACLQLGPVSLFDRNRPPEILPQLTVQDINTYTSARRGVSIPTSMQKQGLIALQQCESIDLFVPELDRHILQLDANNLEAEHTATLSIYDRPLTDSDSSLMSNLIVRESPALFIPFSEHSLDQQDNAAKSQKMRERLILLGLLASLLAFVFGLCALIYTIRSTSNSKQNPTYIPREFENAQKN